MWIWEQTAIISLYNINWLVFTTETESVYCAVRTGSLYVNLSISRISPQSLELRCAVCCHCFSQGRRLGATLAVYLSGPSQRTQPALQNHSLQQTLWDLRCREQRIQKWRNIFPFLQLARHTGFLGFKWRFSYACLSEPSFATVNDTSVACSALTHSGKATVMQRDSCINWDVYCPSDM